MAVVKIIELIATSEKSWEEATKHALEEAAKTVRNITGIDVISCKAEVKNNQIVNYKVNVKIAFLVER